MSEEKDTNKGTDTMSHQAGTGKGEEANRQSRQRSRTQRRRRPHGTGFDQHQPGSRRTNQR